MHIVSYFTYFTECTKVNVRNGQNIGKLANKWPANNVETQINR